MFIQWRFNIRFYKPLWQTLLVGWHNFPSQTPSFLLFFIKDNRALDVYIINLFNKVELYWGFSEKDFAFLMGIDRAGKTHSPLPTFLNADILPGARSVILRPKRKDQQNYRGTGPGIHPNNAISYPVRAPKLLLLLMFSSSGGVNFWNK